MWRLKPGRETFEVMSGEFEGRVFKRGQVYDQVPAGLESCFEPVQPSQEQIKRPRQYQPAKKAQEAQTVPGVTTEEEHD